MERPGSRLKTKIFQLNVEKHFVFITVNGDNLVCVQAEDIIQAQVFSDHLLEADVIGREISTITPMATPITIGLKRGQMTTFSIKCDPPW